MVTDVLDSSDGTNTPAGEPTDDDFFSSWDKPTIKRPSNPPSRTTTPSAGSRAASPFLTASNSNGDAVGTRPKSPLGSTEPRPATTSAAIRKTGPSFGAVARPKANILGAKKTTKLGAKKLAPGAELDFEAAEKVAKEEAERIEKLGYDAEEERKAEEERAKSVAARAESTTIVSPTPISPKTSQQRERSQGEMERLGTGMGRLGFGQVGAASKPGTKAGPSKMGFGSVGVSRAAQDSSYPLTMIYWQSETSRLTRDVSQTTPNTTLAANSQTRNRYLLTSSLAEPTTTRQHRRKHAHAFRASKAPPRSLRTRTSDGRRTSTTPRARLAIMGIWRARRGISSGNSVSRPETIWITLQIWWARWGEGCKVSSGNGSAKVVGEAY